MQYKYAVRVVLLTLIMGGAFFWGYWLSQNLPMNNSAAVLGARVERNGEVEVFKVVQNKTDTSVILPRASVQMEDSGENFVLVLNEYNQVQKKSVQAQVWRKEYAQIVAGLEDQDLVVLSDRVAVGEAVEYRIMNPEAGRSGLVN
jgi:hypothetical protein